MKAVKTIVATAVIVFALTTVAMAGVQHFGGGAGVTGPAPAATAQTAQQGDSVTLSAQQFAALLHAVSRGDAQARAAGQAGVAAHARARTHSEAQAHAHGQTHTAAPTHPAAQTTHRAEIHNTETRTGTHDDPTHAGGSHSGAHDGSGHDGGCD
jgi:hypothetical protein